MKISLLGEKQPKQIIEKIKAKFPIARCKTVLEKGGKVFSEEDVLMVRDFLINISDIAYQIFQKQMEAELDQKPEQECKIICLKQENEDIENAA